ncbi:MAG: class I SAM-dependent methyltransferase [Candidatus Dormibacteraeota bacterium]|nr:class I SAM-dependent methyltransferase [Candidatus Dormibacteraeota bacterium]
MKPTDSLHQLEEERAVPWRDPGLYAGHRARYGFAAPAAAGRRVLDVGCGEGYGAAELAGRASAVVAVDYSPAAIAHAREKYQVPNLTFEVMDALELENGRFTEFDLVTCFEVIEHIEDGRRLMAGLARAVRPGGRLYLSTPNRLVDRLFETVGGHDTTVYHINLMTPRALRALARRHFDSVALYGQSVRGNRLHACMKAMDVANLRHRFVRSARLQRKIVTGLMNQPAHASEADFRFSRLLVRQAPQTVLVASLSARSQAR